jgi:hypothetical protein
MRKSKNAWLLSVIVLFSSEMNVLPANHGKDHFYDLALLQLTHDPYPDVCLLSETVKAHGSPWDIDFDRFFYLTTVNNHAGFEKPSSVRLGRDAPKNVATAYLSAGDLNKDGLVDVVATSINAADVFILFQKTDFPGGFDRPVLIEVGGTPRKPAVGDLNADGLSDIAVSGTEGNLTILFSDDSDPGYRFQPVSLDYASVYVEVGDLNGDLQNDMVIAGTDNVLVLFQDLLNPGAFFDALKLEGGLKPVCVKIADMDGDGLMDIVAGFGGSEEGHDSGSISIFLQQLSSAGGFPSSGRSRFILRGARCRRWRSQCRRLVGHCRGRPVR